MKRKFRGLAGVCLLLLLGVGVYFVILFQKSSAEETKENETLLSLLTNYVRENDLLEALLFLEKYSTYQTALTVNYSVSVGSGAGTALLGEHVSSLGASGYLNGQYSTDIAHRHRRGSMSGTTSYTVASTGTAAYSGAVMMDAFLQTLSGQTFLTLHDFQLTHHSRGAELFTILSLYLRKFLDTVILLEQPLLDPLANSTTFYKTFGKRRIIAEKDSFLISFYGESENYLLTGVVLTGDQLHLTLQNKHSPARVVLDETHIPGTFNLHIENIFGLTGATIAGVIKIGQERGVLSFSAQATLTLQGSVTGTFSIQQRIKKSSQKTPVPPGLRLEQKDVFGELFSVQQKESSILSGAGSAYESDL